MDEQLEEFQSDLLDVEKMLEEAKQHLSCATGCETREDFKDNVQSLKDCLKEILQEVNKATELN